MTVIWTLIVWTLIVAGTISVTHEICERHRHETERRRRADARLRTELEYHAWAERLRR